MRSLLGSVGSRRRSTTSTALLNASAFGLREYVDTLSPLVAMLLLDRSWVIVGKILKYYVPQQIMHRPLYFQSLFCIGTGIADPPALSLTFSVNQMSDADLPDDRDSDDQF